MSSVVVEKTVSKLGEAVNHMQAGVVSELSFFNQLHPLTAACYFIELFTLLLLFNHILLTATMFIGILTVCSWYFEPRKIRQMVVGSGTLMLMIMVFNLLLNQTGRHVLWTWQIGPVQFRLTETAIIYGCSMALSLGAMILTFVLFNGIITIPKLSYLLFPVVPRLAMLLTISLRLVELFIQKMGRLARFQKNRNVVLTEGNFHQRLQKMGQLLRIVLIDAVSGAMETAVLMEARGFGAKRRSQYQRFQFQMMDGAFLLGSTALFAVLIGRRLEHWGWATNVMTLQWQLPHDWLLAGLLIVFMALPIIGEGGYRVWTN